MWIWLFYQCKHPLMSRCVTLVFQHFALCSYSCQQRNHRLYCIVLCTHYYWSMIKLIKLMQINICIMMKDDVKNIYVIFRWRFHEFIALNFCNMLRLHSMSSSCKHCLVNHWWLLSEIKQHMYYKKYNHDYTVIQGFCMGNW